MKNNLWKNILCMLMTALMIVQTSVISVFAEDETLPEYQKAVDFADAEGKQGYNGWYYMYKDSSGTYNELTWDGNESRFVRGDNKVYAKIINPGWNSPTAIVWKAQYTGVITLNLTEPIYRVAANATNSSCGDITASILHNGDQLKQNDGTDAKWLFDNATSGADSKKDYNIEDFSVQKGDLIYFEVDCGMKNANTEIFWNPIVKYTAYTDEEEETLPKYTKADDFSAAKGEQGYNGWYYKYKDSSGTYNELTWDGSGSMFVRGDNKVYAKIINPGWNSPTAIVWKAQYTGVITLNLTEPMYRVAANATNSSCGDITASILHNGDQLKQNDGTDAKWLFDNATSGADSKKDYNIEDFSVQKGDLIYFEVDCGIKNAFTEIVWNPIVQYTYVESVQPEPPEGPGVPEQVLPDSSELKYNMSTAFPYENGKQGTGGWYYFYYSSSAKDWAELTWHSSKRFVRIDNNGNVSNYISQNGIVHPAVGESTAIAWKAPMSGTVRLTTAAGIRKVAAGAATSAAILHNDKTIWSAEIPGNQVDETLAEKYDIELDVKCGDLLYFEIGCSDPSNAGTLWVPKVEYKQMARFSSGDTRIDKITDISDGDTIECLFYDEGKFEEKVSAYLALYNSEGTMVRISDPAQFGGGKTKGQVLSFGTDFTGETYEGWELRVMIINGDGTNINPLRDPELYCVK